MPTPYKRTSEPSLDELNSAHALRDFHHKALWEEQKHFTWLCSIVLSALALVISTDSIATGTKTLLTYLLSIAGVTLSVIALRVVQLEAQGYADASKPFLALRRRFPNLKTEYDSKSTGGRTSFLSLHSVRGLFSWIFLLFGAVFFVIGCIYMR